MALRVDSRIVFPYKNFRFQVKWNNAGGNPITVAGVSKVSGLKWTTEVVSHREGNDPSTPRHSPGRTSFEAITLERGVTFNTDFEEWASLVYAPGAIGGVSLANFKKNLTIELLNTQGNIVVVRRYQIFNAWVSSYTAQADLDANANAALIESMVLQNEGWQRDDQGLNPQAGSES
jgi:phage tail-like protein